MNDDFYKKAYFAALTERTRLAGERDSLDKRRAEVERRITQLDHTLDGLRALAGIEVGDTNAEIADAVKGLGLADACRVVLLVKDRYLIPAGVRNILQGVGYDLSNQANPLASIHAIMKRFAESGEADELEVEGKTGYRLKAVPKEQTSAVNKKAAPGKAKRLREARERANLIQPPFDLEGKKEK